MTPIATEVRRTGGRIEEVWSLPLDEAFLFELYRDLFDKHWADLTWGPIIGGAAYELRCPGKPKSITLLDGYLTVHWGAGGHFHLCIGENRSALADLAERRRPGRCELYRQLDKHEHPISWGLRMFNGQDEPQISIFLPNPFLTVEDGLADQPDWDRLALWSELFPHLTGHALDGRDRLGIGYR